MHQFVWNKTFCFQNIFSSYTLHKLFIFLMTIMHTGNSSHWNNQISQCRNLITAMKTLLKLKFSHLGRLVFQDMCLICLYNLTLSFFLNKWFLLPQFRFIISIPSYGLNMEEINFEMKLRLNAIKIFAYFIWVCTSFCSFVWLFDICTQNWIHI